MSTKVNEFDTVYAPPGKTIDDQGAEYESVQSAVDNANSWVLVGPGKFQEQVDLSGFVDFTLRGSGAASEIVGPSGGSTAITTGLGTGAEDLTITDMSVRSQDSGSNDAITFDAPRSKLRNLTIKEAGAAAILILNSRCTVSGCDIDASGPDSIGGSGINVSDANTSIIESNRITGVDGAGIVVGGFGGTDSVIDGNTVENAGNNGIVVRSDNIVSDNQIINITGDGVDVSDAEDVVISGNRITASGSAINESNASNIVKTGNVTASRS